MGNAPFLTIPFRTIMTGYAMSKDRSFFRVFPDTICLLRAEYDGEWESPAGAARILVIRSRVEGVRMRIRVHARGREDVSVSLKDTPEAREWIRTIDDKIIAGSFVIDVDEDAKDAFPKREKYTYVDIMKQFYVVPQSFSSLLKVQ